MITCDTAKLEADISAFNKKLKERFALLGGRKATIVKRQAGLLCRTLINITPPRDRKKTAEKITSQVNKRFQQMGSDNSGHVFSDPGPIKAGKGSVRWYAFGPKSIYGIAKEVDFRDASPEQLYQLYFKRKLGGDGRFIAGKRGKQLVKIWQIITVKASTVKVLIDRLIGHIGRLAAGWTIGWDECGQPGRALPRWIEKHAGKSKGARGYAVNGLGIPNSPEFTIANTAEGASPAKMQYQLRAALQIRTKAMENDTIRAIQHPDQWNDQEAAADAAAEDV